MNRKIVEGWCAMARTCSTIKEYETKSGHDLEEMPVEQLLGWLIVRGDSVSAQTADACITTGCIEKAPEIWTGAIVRSIREGFSLDYDILIDETPSGEGTRFIPSLISLPETGA